VKVSHLRLRSEKFDDDSDDDVMIIIIITIIIASIVVVSQLNLRINEETNRL
jgi:hypothetical protein